MWSKIIPQRSSRIAKSGGSGLDLAIQAEQEDAGRLQRLKLRIADSKVQGSCIEIGSGPAGLP